MTTEQIYRNNYEMIEKYIYNRTNDKLLAEDLAQDTFVKMLNFDEELIEEDTVEAWLRMIASNIISDYFRKKSIDISYTDDITKYDYQSISDTNLQFENNDTFDYIVNLIPEKKFRDVIILKFKEDMSYKEMSEFLNEDSNTLRVWVHRGIEWLRRNKLEMLEKFL